MPMNIKQPAYSLLTYPSIEPSFYSSSKGSLQLHQLATMILESSLVYSSDNYTIDIVLHPVIVYSRRFFPFDFENKYIRCCPEFNCKHERINPLLSVKGLISWQEWVQCNARSP